MSPPTSTWPDLLQALDFVQGLFDKWHQDRALSDGQHAAIATHYRDLAAQCTKAMNDHQPVPADLELPPRDRDLADLPAAHELQFQLFACREIKKHEEAGRLPLYQAHTFLTETRERVAALRRRLDQQRAVYKVKEPSEVKPVVLEAAEPEDSPRPRVQQAPAQPRRNLLEILLDPRSIQWLLGLGGALMVVGLVLFLWFNDYFTPPVVAVTLGVANGALLAGGWFLIRSTRYQTAGRAVTLLACLVMPLNLWYYNANNLIVIGGHLWVAALVISVLYAASALVLRDEMFVYVFVGGVALTGLLILADLEKFWEIALPSTMLVVLGLLAIHAERAFPEQEGPFSRKRFGLAFFWSGHALLAAGLLLVFGAQLAGHWLYEPLFKDLYVQLQAKPSPIVDELRLLAIALVVAGTYAYIYSDLVVRRVGVYVYIAAFTLLWAEVLIVEQLHLELGVDAIIAVLAGTALVVNLVQATVTRDSRYTRAFPILGLLLGLLPVVLGLAVYGQALSSNFRGVWEAKPPTWGYVGAMLLTAISCRVGAHLYRHTMPKLSALYFFATAAATMVGAVALLAAFGLKSWEQHAPLLMVFPILYLVAAQLSRGHTAERPLVWVSHAATGVMLVSSLATAFEGFTHIVEGRPLNLALAGFFAEAALFYGLATAWRKQVATIHLCAAMACAAVWQLLTYAGVQGEYYTLTFAVVGLALLIAYRFAVLERYAAGKLADAAFQSANTLLSLSFVGAALMGLSRLASRDVQWEFVGLCSALTLMSLLAAGLVRHPDWRRWYLVTTIGLGLLTFLAVQVLSRLSPWQKLEIFCVAVGLVLLAVGHLGWYREQDRQSDVVDLSLLLGSLLAGVPLAIAAISDRYYRGFEGFYILNEIGFLAVAVLLLATGVVFQLKSTTLVGAALTALYFVTLLVLVPWSRLAERINYVAISIIVGGGVIFGTGLLLSVYRERLMALPEKIQRREGIFRVLSWR
jgi:hypothetical protein